MSHEKCRIISQASPVVFSLSAGEGDTVWLLWVSLETTPLLSQGGWIFETSSGCRFQEFNNTELCHE